MDIGAELAEERRRAVDAPGEYGVDFDFPVQRSLGALPPLLFQGLRSLLTSYVDEPHGDWDGTNPRCVDPADTTRGARSPRG